MPSTGKIAILLLVHKNENQVNRLIRHLSKDFDVYIHVDKRSRLNLTKGENVFVYRKYKPYWGSFNIILATLLLLREAHKKNYDRYILLSGQDIPIKTNERIKEFFVHNDNEYIANFSFPCPFWTEGGLDRVSKYHFQKDKPSRRHVVQYRLYTIDRLLFKLIRGNKKRPYDDYRFFGGSQWFAFTHDCTSKIFEYLKQDKQYLKRYRWTSCCDEVFFQTLVNMIPGLSIVNKNFRYIDWEKGPEYPRTLRTEDYEKVIHSENLFARKFVWGVPWNGNCTGGHGLWISLDGGKI